MLRSLEHAPEIHPSLPSSYPVFAECPDCHGEGWFELNIQKAMGKRFCACPTCIAMAVAIKETGELPVDIKHIIEAKANAQ